jgi:S-methylmethionine-dependent homocysteine/selenocysteine methylase
VTLLDGGMGQELVRRSGKPPTPLWSTAVMAEQPDLVETLHLEFITAGADIITINAYSCTPERLAQHADASQFEQLQRTACQLAQKARSSAEASQVQIAGCLPPLVASYHPELAPDAETSLATYRRVCDVQAPSVDLFLCETMASIAESIAAGTAACETGKPVWVAMTLDDRQPERLRSGELLSDAVDALRSLPLHGLLLNCSRPETISSAWAGFVSHAALPVGAYANGFTAIDALVPGGTVNTLEARMDLGPEAYSAFAQEWVRQGASLVGGCCEVGPAHIARLRQLLDASA